jgi:hypothetical protein
MLITIWQTPVIKWFIADNSGIYWRLPVIFYVTTNALIKPFFVAIKC